MLFVKKAIFWFVVPCSLVEIYQRSRGPCCLRWRTSETLVNFYQTTRRYNPEDSHLRIYRRENLKSYYVICICKNKLTEVKVKGAGDRTAFQKTYWLKNRPTGGSYRSSAYSSHLPSLSFHSSSRWHFEQYVLSRNIKPDLQSSVRQFAEKRWTVFWIL
jgi:hypothetical protein